MEFLVLLGVSLLLSFTAYLLTPKPKQPSTKASDLNAPTVSAGRPVGVLFGTATLKAPNVLGYWDKRVREYKVKV